MLFLLMTLVMFFQGKEAPHTETGTASYYSSSLEGNLTSSGEVYRQDSLTAAHPTLPFGTYLKVQNTDNSKAVVVKVNDRGPFTKNRIIDLSRAAFKQIAPLSEGVVEVRIEEVSPPKR